MCENIRGYILRNVFGEKNSFLLHIVFMMHENKVRTKNYRQCAKLNGAKITGARKFKGIM